MKRSLQVLLMIVSFIALNSCKNDITFSVFQFDDSKTTATNITENSVTLNCQVINTENGKYGINHRHLYIGIADYPEYFDGQSISSGWKTNKEFNGEVHEGQYSIDFTELKPNTTYYYAPFVPEHSYSTFDNMLVGNIILRGEVKSFTTKGLSSITVTTGNVTNITNSSATLSSTYKLVNDAKLEEFGILLHTYTPSYDNYTQRQTSKVSPFTYTFTGLTGNKTYYYRAYAKDNKGTIYYGDTRSFTTSSSPRIDVTTNNATNITSSSVTLKAECSLLYGAKLKEIGICISEYGHELTWTCVSYYWYDYRASGTSSPYTHTFNGLTSNTSYYACAYAIDTDDNVYESYYVTFTTSNSGQGSGYSMNDYIGTYTMTYRTDEKSGVQTWNNVRIGSNTSGETYLQNLPPYGYTAYGEWDETNHKLVFSDVLYCLDDVFKYEDHEVAPIFTPVYYNTSTDDLYTTFQSDGFAYIDFKMTSSGIIKMSSPSTAGTNGYYSNAYLWDAYNTSTWESEGISDVVYDVTLTKTSSNYAPANTSPMAPNKCEKSTQNYKSLYQNNTKQFLNW